MKMHAHTSIGLALLQNTQKKPGTASKEATAALTIWKELLLLESDASKMKECTTLCINKLKIKHTCVCLITWACS